MQSKNDPYKTKVMEAVERRKNEFLEILCRAVRCNTDNPPGDTRSFAAYIDAFLRQKGIPAVIYDPIPENPNIVAFIGEPLGRPHLVLNGHLDQFPADDPALWTDNPYAGKIRDGKIYGRGVSDMKGGTIASLLAMVLLHELGVPLTGRLTFTGVSDEETGGRWGTGWLLENVSEISSCDAVLNGEPYAPDVVGVGERGAFRFVLRVEGEPMHGALSAGDNAICKLSEALLALRPIVKEKAVIPADMAGVIEAEKKYIRSPQDVGRQWMLDHPSYNVGVIRGGTKINVVPRFAEAEVDIRIPWGMTPELIENKVTELLKGSCSEARISKVITQNAPTYTALDDPLVQIVRRNAFAVNGKEPIYFCGMGGTDCRFFRWRGIPSVVYGPRPVNMGGIDEHIFIEEYLTVIKVHALSIIDYLGLKA